MPSSQAFVVGVLLMTGAGSVALPAVALRVSARQAVPASPFLRSRVDLVSLSVSVTDRTNHYVADLEQQDFTVFEEGLPQSVTYFRKTEAPLVVTLLLDASSSMRLKLATAQRAAIGFVEQLAPADVASVLQFGTRVSTLQGLTRDPQALVTAIRRAVADGQTALYTAAYVALRELGSVTVADQGEGIRRRVLVVLSDGKDNASVVNYTDVLDAASRSDTVIYSIALRAMDLFDSTEDDNSIFLLRQLAERTGGRIFVVRDAQELTDVYQRIHEELQHQYMLAYASRRPPDGSWRRLRVQVTRAGVLARTKEGYFAPRR
jgi:Ca-activated chloride channel family protein